MNLNFPNNKSSRLNIKSNLWLVTLLLVIVGISFSCKKYTKEEEQYRITVESEVPIKKVNYRLKKNSEEALSFSAPESGGTYGSFASLDNYEYVLDTNIVADDMYRFIIYVFYGSTAPEEVDALTKCNMVRTQTDEVVFEKVFREGYKIYIHL